jgi:hypothetical protein
MDYKTGFIDHFGIDYKPSSRVAKMGRGKCFSTIMFPLQGKTNINIDY